MGCIKRYNAACKLHAVFEERGVPMEQRRWLMHRVASLNGQGLRGAKLREALIREVRDKGPDWQRLLELLIELAKVIIPLILALL